MSFFFLFFLFLLLLHSVFFSSVFFFLFFLFFGLCSTQLFHFWGSVLFSTLQGSFNLCYFIFFLSFQSSFLVCLKNFLPMSWGDFVWLMVHSNQEPSLEQSTHLFLVMFFWAYHRAPFCSEYFLLFCPFFLPTYCQWFCSFQLHVFFMGLSTSVNVLHFFFFFV